MGLKKQWKSKKPYKKTKKAKSVLARSPSGIKLQTPGMTLQIAQRDKVYTFIQRVSGEELTLVSTPLSSYGGIAKYMKQGNAEESYSFAFCMGDVGQRATFTAIFDEYRIDKVVMNFRPLFTANIAASVPLTGASAGVGTIYDPGTIIVCIDNDDYADATSGDLRQCNGSQIIRCVQENDIVVTVNRPKTSVALYQGAFTGYGSVNSGWIDCDSLNVQHFGVKVAIDKYETAAPVLQAWCVDCVYYISFRGVK